MLHFRLILTVLAGLSSALSIYDSWEVDTVSCSASQVEKLEKAFLDTGTIVAKAVDDLSTAKTKRPKDGDSALTEWIRVQRNFETAFGFSPQGKLGTLLSGNTKHLSYAENVVNRMHTALQGKPVSPKGGYSGEVDKPLLLCNLSPFKWYNRYDTDPYDPREWRLVDTKKKLMEENKGAWIYARRYLTPSELDVKSLDDFCAGSRAAVTFGAFDMIVLCDKLFDRPGPEPVEGKSSYKKGQDLDDIEDDALTPVMAHEFAHYYGFIADKKKWHLRVTDVPAVNFKGRLLWVSPNTGAYTFHPRGADIQLRSYEFRFVRDLAITNDAKDQDNDSRGPKFATKNADSYWVWFAMSYLDNWDWTIDGLAKDFSEDLEGEK